MPTPHPLLARLARSLDLTQAERAALDHVPFTTERVIAGEGVAWAGDRPTRSFLILDGLLSTSKAVAGGAVQITAFHIPGDMPDLNSLHLEVLDSDIGAITNCHLAFMAHQDLRQLCGEHPRLAGLLWRATLVEAAIYREWVVNVAQRPAISRLAHLLCEMLARMDAAGLVRDGSCHLGLTQHHLSEATGLSPVHVNRTLQQLRAMGLLSFGQGRLTVHDWDGLRHVAGFRTDYLHVASAQAA
jgi:CRP-like cAMP-binding protein